MRRVRCGSERASATTAEKIFRKGVGKHPTVDMGIHTKDNCTSRWLSSVGTRDNGKPGKSRRRKALEATAHAVLRVSHASPATERTSHRGHSHAHCARLGPSYRPSPHVRRGKPKVVLRRRSSMWCSRRARGLRQLGEKHRESDGSCQRYETPVDVELVRNSRFCGRDLPSGQRETIRERRHERYQADCSPTLSSEPSGNPWTSCCSTWKSSMRPFASVSVSGCRG